MTSDQETKVKEIISRVADRPIAWSKRNFFGRIDYEAELIFRMSVEFLVGREMDLIPDLHDLHEVIQREYPAELFEVEPA